MKTWRFCHFTYCYNGRNYENFEICKPLVVYWFYCMALYHSQPKYLCIFFVLKQLVYLTRKTNVNTIFHCIKLWKKYQTIRLIDIKYNPVIKRNVKVYVTLILLIFLSNKCWLAFFKCHQFANIKKSFLIEFINCIIWNTLNLLICSMKKKKNALCYYLIENS